MQIFPHQKQSAFAKGGWVKPLYLYAVSLVSLIVIIIGTVTVGNLLIRRYVFGLRSQWYQDPAMSCEHFLPSGAVGINGPKMIPRGADDPELAKLSAAERTKRYNECVTAQAKQMEMQEKFQFADTVSWSVAMILVGAPLYLFHWRIVRRREE